MSLEHPRYLLHRLSALLLSLILLGLCTGCNSNKIFPDSLDVQRLMFTRILAIDSVDHGENKIRVTISSRLISGAANDPSKKIEILSSEGRTIFEAVRNFSNRVDKEVFLGHVDYILLGKEAAQLDLTEFLDGLLRDQMIRKSTCLIACPNMTAEEFLTKGGSEEAFPAERLDNLFLGERMLSQSSHSESIDSQHFSTQNNRIKTIDFIRGLNSLTQTSMIPCLSALSINEEQNQSEESAPNQGGEQPEEGGSGNSEGEGEMKGGAQPGNQMFALDGYAVYKDRLLGYLSGTQGRAVNLLLEQVFAGQLLVHAPDGKNISLEIISSNREFIPKWTEQGKLSVEINLDLSTSIAENQSDINIYTKDCLGDLVIQQNSIIKKEVEDLLKFTKENKCDLIGFANLFAHKYPVRFKKEFADTWADEGYHRIDFSININSVIDHSRNLQGPLLGE